MLRSIYLRKLKPGSGCARFISQCAVEELLGPSGSNDMYCEVCGVDAPTKHVSFHQNIGLLVMRFYRGCTGNLCKSCIHKTFWTYTAVNMTLGWWGIISLIL